MSEGVVERTGPDIRMLPLHRLEWGDGQRRRSAEALAAHVVGDCQSVLAWYSRAKRSKKWMAILLRWVMLIGTGISGLLPLLAEIDGVGLQISPGWASVALGAVGAAVGVDKYFGFSSGWMRYVGTTLKVTSLMQRYELLVERERVKWGVDGPTPEQVGALLDLSQNCMTELNQAVLDETNLWMTEFREVTSQLADRARTQSAEIQPGAVTVRVSNGPSCEGGWTLEVDSGAARTCSGATATVQPLTPGIHAVKVRGAIGGRAMVAEGSVTVWPSQVATLDLMLE